MKTPRLTGRQRQERNRRLLRQNDICWICGKPGADSIDHVIPLGPGLGTEDPSNLRPAHMHPCNRAKSDKDHAPIIKRSGALE